MLFDLQGRRRRVVQVTYVGLAVLMGGGLVLSGIGSDAGGGILDAVVGNQDGGTDDARKPLENRIKAAEETLRTNPRDQAALADLVRARFALAGLEAPSSDDPEAQASDAYIEQLSRAEQAWARYIATDPKRIDPGLASTGLAIYESGVPLPEDQEAKNERYVRPAAELAERNNTREAYITLVRVATRAGDTRTAGLAERKALSFAATKDDRATIKQQIDAIKQAAAGAQGAGGNGAAPPAGGP